MLSKFNSFIYNLIFVRFRFWYLLCFNSLIKSQIKNPLTIPIVIINFNQLFFLEKLVDDLLQRGFQNIVIIDNKSSYPPLLSYYQKISQQVAIEYMDDNYGHLVFFKTAYLQHKYARGYYVITDPDIGMNPRLPIHFMDFLIELLNKKFNSLTKVGFALNITDIPDSYLLKDKVIQWEQQFWQNQIAADLFEAGIDTTFALYKPGYPKFFKNEPFVKAIRVGGDFTAIHGGWMIDSTNLTDENQYYMKHSSTVSNSWKYDKEGKVMGYFQDKY